MRSYKFEIYKDKNNQYRFRIVASNGRIVGDSGESYRTKYFCLKNIKRLKEMISNAEIIDNGEGEEEN